MALVLEVQFGKRRRTFLLTGDDVTIGRAEGNSLRLNIPELEPHHCIITLSDGHTYIRDLGTKIGTKVNGNLVQGKVPFRHGDTAEFGNVFLRLRFDDKPEPDLYSKWLGIASDPRPVDYYMLLGVDPYTSDVALLHESANRRLETLEKYVLTPDRQLRDACQNMMNEVALAVTTLTDSNRRPDYESTVAERYPIQLEIAPVNSSNDEGPAAQQVIDWRSLRDLDTENGTSDELPFIERSRQERRTRRASPKGTTRQLSVVLTGLVVLVIGAAVIVALNSRGRPTDRRMPLDDPASTASSPSTETSPKIEADPKSITTPPIVVNPSVTQVPPSKATPPPSRSRLRLDIATGQTVELILIEPGEFMMGSELSPDDLARRFGMKPEDFTTDQFPQIKVQIAQPYFIGMTEVTRSQFAAFVKDTGYRTEAEIDGRGAWGWSDNGLKLFAEYTWLNVGFDQTDNHPVVNVSQKDAVEFCAWFERKTGFQTRLPSEAEWEYACRAGSATLYQWGDAPSDGDGWGNIADVSASRRFRDLTAAQWDDQFVFTAPVGSFKPNKWGIHDMIGNVWEWCISREPIPVAVGSLPRCLRGGGWDDSPAFSRCAHRDTVLSITRGNNIGFRIVVATQPGTASAALSRVPDSGPSSVTTSTGEKSKSTQLELGGGAQMKFVRIEAGVFLMGSPLSEAERRDNEKQHEVRIMKPFYMGETEVTQAQYMAVMDKNPSAKRGNDLPVEQVAWEDAAAFCKKLSEKTNGKIRLPTEAEWEYACRAGKKSPFNTGYTISVTDANYRGDHVYGGGAKGVYRMGTIPVGSLKQPNNWGLHDMHGNVFEWCNDWHGDYPVGTVTDPIGPAKGTARILRGGCWDYLPANCRAAYRDWNLPNYRAPNIGFRVVLEMSQDDAVTVENPPGEVPQKEMRSIPAKIMVDNMEPTIFDPVQSKWPESAEGVLEYPEWLQNATVYLKPIGQITPVANIRVVKSGLLLLSCHFGYEGNSSGDWQKEVTSLGQLKADGWEVVGQIVHKNGRKAVIVQRNGREGEVFKIRANKYSYPVVILITEANAKLQGALDLIETPVQREARLAKIADLWKTAMANDNKTTGKTALAALEELLKLDPNHGEAKKLRDKIAGYFGPPVLDLSNGVKLATVHIKAGRFTMGSPAGETNRPNETQKSVTIDRDFYMGESEVTQAQWKVVMGTTPWKGQKNVEEGDDYPATYVSWDDAKSFMEKVSRMTGKKVRLPTEAEWEYACRAGTTTAYSFGDSDRNISDYAWWGGIYEDGNTKSKQYAQQVKTKRPNAWGLYDMHGNVFEWCEDRHGQGPRSATSRVMRGGSWAYGPDILRSAARLGGALDLRGGGYGFRVVLEF